MTPNRMETMHEAIARLEEAGFELSFRATGAGELVARGVEPLKPESLIVEETVRFEGASDPGDEAVLFALRSGDGRHRGIFVASFGPNTEPACVAAIQRLESKVA